MCQSSSEMTNFSQTPVKMYFRRLGVESLCLFITEQQSLRPFPLRLKLFLREVCCPLQGNPLLIRVGVMDTIVLQSSITLINLQVIRVTLMDAIVLLSSFTLIYMELSFVGLMDVIAPQKTITLMKYLCLIQR